MDTINEYDYLKNYLEANGLYERGMTLDDMKKVQQAILESLSDSGLNVDLEIALRESEQDFMQEMLYNSTMISSDGNYNNSQNGTLFNNYSSNAITAETGYSTESARSSSPPSSPDNPQTMLVFAQVHHELNYDPESDPGHC